MRWTWTLPEEVSIQENHHVGHMIGPENAYTGDKEWLPDMLPFSELHMWTSPRGVVGKGTEAVRDREEERMERMVERRRKRMQDRRHVNAGTTERYGPLTTPKSKSCKPRPVLEPYVEDTRRAEQLKRDVLEYQKTVQRQIAWGRLVSPAHAIQTKWESVHFLRRCLFRAGLLTECYQNEYGDSTIESYLREVFPKWEFRGLMGLSLDQINEAVAQVKSEYKV